MLLFCIATVLAPSSHNTYRPRSLRESIDGAAEGIARLTRARSRCCAIVLVFKAGDAFANKLFTPFMMDVGFSKTEIAADRQGAVYRSALVGSVLGGLLMVRLGLLRSMLIFGVLQALSNLLYCVLAVIAARATRSWSRRWSSSTSPAPWAASRWSRSSWRCAMRATAPSSTRCCRRWRCCRATASGYPAGWIADHHGWYGVLRRQLRARAAGAGDGVAEAAAASRRSTTRSAALGACARHRRTIDLQRVMCRVAELEAHAARGLHHRRAATGRCADSCCAPAQAGARLRQPLSARRSPAGPDSGALPHRRRPADPVRIARRAVREVDRAVRGGSVSRALADARCRWRCAAGW